MNNLTRFFLGANSDVGFVSYFRQLQEQSDSMQLLILKGGPGSGKSSLMKKVVAAAKEKGHEIEIIPCASDTDSLDGFIDKTISFAMIDGTAPHTEDPLFPGALQHIMYTGDLWDTDILNRNSRKIKSLNTRINDFHKGAGAYIKAASALLTENIRQSRNYVCEKSASAFFGEITKELPSGNFQNETKRLLSAVTGGEIKYFKETVLSLADKILVLDDSWGGAASFILENIRSCAKAAGTYIIHCPCSIMPGKTDHIIIPKLRLAILTENRFLPVPFGQKISCGGFYKEMPDIEISEQRIQKAQDLLCDACSLVKEAKLLHDELERIYVSAMDFSRMDSLFESIIKNFYSGKKDFEG